MYPGRYLFSVLPWSSLAVRCFGFPVSWGSPAMTPEVVAILILCLWSGLPSLWVCIGFVFPPLGSVGLCDWVDSRLCHVGLGTSNCCSMALHGFIFLLWPGSCLAHLACQVTTTTDLIVTTVQIWIFIVSSYSGSWFICFNRSFIHWPILVHKLVNKCKNVY